MGQSQVDIKVKVGVRLQFDIKFRVRVSVWVILVIHLFITPAQAESCEVRTCITLVRPRVDIRQNKYAYHVLADGSITGWLRDLGGVYFHIVSS